MTNQISDQYNGDPTYAQLHVLTRNRPLVRDRLKTASFDAEKVANLPSSAFAWEDERRFPVHTEADTVASILYRSKLGSAVPAQVDDKLAKAAAIYGIPDVIFAGEKTAAAPDVEYALPSFVKTAGVDQVDHSESRLPLDGEFNIKLAEDVLCRDFQRLPLNTRADAFSRLTKAAQLNGVSLRPLTMKLAGLTITNTPRLCDWLEARATVTDGPIKEAFDRMASKLRKAGAEIEDRASQIKLASTIAQLDKKAGLERYYDRKLPDPLLTVFNTTKIAEDSCDVAGKKVACSVLMRLPEGVWEDVDMAEMSKIADNGDTMEFKQAFDTIPADIKMILRDYV